MENLSDELQSKVFRNLIDLTDFRNCRLVSQKWKRTVVEACRNKFHVVYPLTNSTLYTARQLNETLVSFDIYAFTGKGNKGAWQNSGIEPLMQTTEWLQFSGSEITTEEIRKILNLARNSLKTLSFKIIKTNLVHPLLQMQENFRALRKVVLGYYSIKSFNDTFKTFTDTLEKWNSLDCRVELPLLESLNLSFDGRHVPELQHNMYRPIIAVTTNEIFRNYVAIAKLLLKYKHTLRKVQIERVFSTYNLNLFRPNLVQPEWSAMERGLEALDELNLSHLKMSTTLWHNASLDIAKLTPELGFLGIEVLGRPKNLKNLLFNNLICHNDNWCPLIATLSSFNNEDGRYLTSLKISLYLWNNGDPTMVINLKGLKQCRNLRTLWFLVNTTSLRQRLFVRNVEFLPKGISTLRFEPTLKYRNTMGVEILATQQQIRWIIDNLRDLETCRMSLVIPEQTNANENIAQRVDAGADNNDVANNAQLQQVQQEEENRLININLDTFRDLINMPILKDLKVDMMKARALSFAAGPWQIAQQAEQARLGTTLDVIREYSDLCDAAGYTITTTTSPNFGADNIYGFATLAVLRNQN